MNTQQARIQSVFRDLESRVLIVGALVLVLVLLFPPFVLHVQTGLIINSGFAFILSPPRNGAATVNVGLLAILVSGVVAVTAAMYLVVQKIERNS